MTKVKGNAGKHIVSVPKKEGASMVRKSMGATICQRSPGAEIAAAAERLAKQKKGGAAEKNEKTRALFDVAKEGKWGTVMSEVTKDNINERDVRGMTLLMVAAEQGEYAIVRRLVKNGAQKDATDDYEKSALTHALLNEHNKVAELLQELDTNWKFDLYVAVRDRRKMLVMTMKEVLGATDEDVARAEAECDPKRGPALSHRVQRVGGEANAQQDLTVALQPSRVGTARRDDSKVVEPGSAPTAPKKPHIGFRGC